MKAESLKSSLSRHLSASPGGANPSWASRLSRAMSFPSEKEAKTFLAETIQPAMEEVKAVLTEKGYHASLESGDEALAHLGLKVDLGEELNFAYRVYPNQCLMPSFSLRAPRPQAYYYRLEVHLHEGGQGYDLMGYSKEQVIEDIVDQFENHLHFLHLQREAGGGSSAELGDAV